MLGNSMGFKELLAHQLLFVKKIVRFFVQSFKILENILKLAFKANVFFCKTCQRVFGY
jgi:hypothetical protein